MKNFIFYLLVIIGMTSALPAGNLTEVGTITNSQMTFVLKKQKSYGKTILSVEVSPNSTPIWNKTVADFPDGANILDYWQIIDGHALGNDVAFLVGMDRGILWVKASKTGDDWTIRFAQELYAVASLGLKTEKIALNGINSVVVTDDKGVSTSFTRTDKGELQKNGILYTNTPPFRSIIVP